MRAPQRSARVSSPSASSRNRRATRRHSAIFASSGSQVTRPHFPSFARSPAIGHRATRRIRAANGLWPKIVIPLTLLIGVCISSPAGASSSRHTLTGSVVIADSQAVVSGVPDWSPGGQCDGSTTNGYGDLSAGAQVTVKNGSGRIVAVGTIREGKPNYDGATCTMPLKVSGIPKASFYQVEVSHRGELSYSYAQLQRRHWRVSLTIGG